VANSSNPRRLAILIVLLVVLAAVAVYRLRPALVESIVPSSDTEKAAQVGNYNVPLLGWEKAKPRVVPNLKAGRNLFTFGPSPTPTPDLRPTPTPVPTLPPRPMPPTPTPTPAPWGNLPPPPEFSLTYLGWLGPDRLPIAVFKDGDEVLAVPVGETVKQRFIIREVGPTAVTVGFTGYPEKVTSKVGLAR
jgi:hypothetical protein